MSIDADCDTGSMPKQTAGLDLAFKREWLVLLSLVLLIGLVFFRTIFQGKPISKLCRIANWDSVFQDYSNTCVGFCDPSLVQLLIPNYFLVAKQWHHLQIPLWNSFSGCGMPLVGDVQASVFGPVRFALALFPSTTTYNLILVGEVLVCILGTYCLARLLAVKKIPAVFAAVCYSFCPYTLYYLELLSGTSAALLPLLLASYVYAARSTSLFAVVVASLVTTSFVLSGHPESSLFGVVFSLVLYMVVSFCLPRFQPGPSPLLLRICMIGALSLALAAPMILPFVEYLACGDSYKYGDGRSGFAPWPGLILNLLGPSYGPASPFLGAVAVIMLPALILVARKFRRLVFALLVLATVCLMLISRLGILDHVLAIRPLSYLVTVYLIPLYLLLLSVISSMGLQAFSEKIRGVRQLIVVASLSIVFQLSLFSGNANLHAFDFDATLGDMKIEPLSVCLSGFLLVLFFMLVVVCQRRRYRDRASELLLISALLLNCVSLLPVARLALPVQPYFNFPETELTEFLARHSGRVLSVVEHVLKPNTNVVYGISSLRVHNPLQPARFAEFASLCGATLDEFRNQSYGSLTRVVDLASVKYIVSQAKPVSERFDLIHTTAQGIKVYENPHALPECYVAYQCLSAKNKDEASALLTSSRFNPSEQVILESADTAAQATSSVSGRKIEPLALVRASSSELFVETSVSQGACLVVTDTFYPGWQAFLDGREVPIYRANFLFRGILVPAGRHQIHIQYLPLSFKLGVLLALLGLTVILFLSCRGLVALVRRRSWQS